MKLEIVKNNKNYFWGGARNNRSHTSNNKLHKSKK